MLKKMWQNLGLTYKDIKDLPLYTTEMLVDIMRLEEQYEARDIKGYTNNNNGKSKNRHNN